MKLIITGARGRLGRVLRQTLGERGHQVTAFSRNADGSHLPLSALAETIEAGGVDTILHLAWSTVPATAEQDPGVEWREDLPLLASSLGVLAREQAKQGRAPRLIFFSTCAVYGEPSGETASTERDEPRPKGWYAAGKVAAERLIGRFTDRTGIPAMILRITNPYGFTQGEQCLQGVIPAMVQAALAGAPFSVWGAGDARKDYLHIGDFCDAVARAVEGGKSGTFNVASGVSRTVGEVAAAIEKVTGRKLNLRHEAARPWDVQRGKYDNGQWRKESGWNCGKNFEEGLREFVSLLGQGKKS